MAAEPLRPAAAERELLAAGYALPRCRRMMSNASTAANKAAPHTLPTTPPTMAPVLLDDEAWSSNFSRLGEGLAGEPAELSAACMTGSQERDGNLLPPP